MERNMHARENFLESPVQLVTPVTHVGRSAG
jgi:hypothetical protein